TLVPRSRAPPRRGTASARWPVSGEPVGEEPLDVLEKLFGLVPAIEDPDARRALAGGIGGDDHRHLRTPCARRIGSPECSRHHVRTVEDGDVDAWLEHGVWEALGRC